MKEKEMFLIFHGETNQNERKQKDFLFSRKKQIKENEMGINQGKQNGNKPKKTRWGINQRKWNGNKIGKRNGDKSKIRNENKSGKRDFTLSSKLHPILFWYCNLDLKW